MNTVKIDHRDNGVAWVTIDRPDAMNALSGEVLEELLAWAVALSVEPDVRLIVVTGAGDKAFSAGADLKERRAMTEEQVRARIDLIGRCFTTWQQLPKPTVAAINGVAFGGGLELALACDLRIAVESAQLGLTEVRLGIMPGAGGTQRLPRVVGVARAKELILFGKRIDARRAYQIGLVNQLVPPQGLPAAIDELAAEIKGCAPISVAQAKLAVDRALDLDLEVGLALERSCYEVTLGTDDRKEGLRAFAEKRPPSYVGR